MLKPTKQNVEIGFMTLFLLLTLQISNFAQTKVFEVKIPVGDLTTAALDTLFVYMQKNPESRGVVVIYSGSKQQNLGNIRAIKEGIKTFEKIRVKGSLTNRISIVFAKGKEPLQQDYWLVKKDEDFPEFEEVSFDLSKLTEKHLFATRCISCDTDYPRLSGEMVDYDLLAHILKENQNYEVLIVIDGDSAFNRDGDLISPKKYYKNLTKFLSKKYKLKKSRFKFKHIKPNEKYAGTSAEFYIVPVK